MRSSAIAALGCAALLGFVPLHGDTACSCSAMTLNHSGNTGIMCSNNNLKFQSTECAQFAGSSKGCATTYAYQCNLGVNSYKPLNAKPYKRTGFMPAATIAGTLSDCTIGQVMQETITSGGSLEKNPLVNPTSMSGTVSLAGHAVEIVNNSKNPFPQVGATASGKTPQFGGDNYGNPGDATVLFNTTSKSVSWWDNTDQSKDSQAEVAAWKYKFISFVNGSSKGTSCACAFDIAVSWNGTAAPTTAWSKDAALSTSCTF